MSGSSWNEAESLSFPRRCRYLPELKDLGLTEFREAILPPYRILIQRALEL